MQSAQTISSCVLRQNEARSRGVRDVCYRSMAYISDEYLYDGGRLHINMRAWSSSSIVRPCVDSREMMSVMKLYYFIHRFVCIQVIIDLDSFIYKL